MNNLKPSKLNLANEKPFVPILLTGTQVFNVMSQILKILTLNYYLLMNGKITNLTII